jgi:hypothetical protein
MLFGGSEKVILALNNTGTLARVGNAESKCLSMITFSLPPQKYNLQQEKI